jgi:hypothetical protein
LPNNNSEVTSSAENQNPNSGDPMEEQRKHAIFLPPSRKEVAARAHADRRTVSAGNVQKIAQREVGGALKPFVHRKRQMAMVLLAGSS